MGTAAVDEVPYERVLMHGHALMPDGRAMSKSKDIRIDPGEVMDEYGTDPMRAFLLSLTARGDDMNFSYEETQEMARRLNILWNVFRFPLPYMRMDGFSPEETSVEDLPLETADRWVLSRLQTVTEEATAAMEEFRQDRALETVLSFVVDDVSRYYVQLVRERMWEEADSESKRAAYATLYRVLRETVALLAPFVPFVTEEIYGALTGDRGHPTVHMCDWPDADADLRDPALEAEFDVVRSIETAGSSARQQAGRKLRWPVQRVVVAAPTDTVADAVDARRDLLADRLNAREVELYGPDATWGELRYAAQADMGELGPAFGDDAGRVMNALNEADLDERSVAAAEAAVAEATDTDVDLAESMVAGWAEVLPDDVAADTFTVERDGEEHTGTVYVDAALTEDIESEGYAREVVRRVQEMRKDLDLDVDAEVRLEVDVDDDRVAELVARHEDYVAEEVRAAELGPVEDGHRREWDVEGVTVTLAVEPLTETIA
jgi:isoleucyl-tRNA synthetase